MCRANGSRLGGPQVPPSPSLRIETGFHTRTTRATAALLGPCFKTGRMQPTASQATTAQGVRRPPGRTDQRGRTLRAVTRPSRRTVESAPAAEADLRYGGGRATALLGGLRTLRTAGCKFASVPKGRPRYLPDSRSSPGTRRTWPALAAESAGTREASTHGRPTGVSTARGTPRGPLNSTRAGSAACVSLPTVSRPL